MTPASQRASRFGWLKQLPALQKGLSRLPQMPQSEGSRDKGPKLSRALARGTGLTNAELDRRLAAEEFALAALIQAELTAVDLPSCPFARLEAGTLPCRTIGGHFHDAVLRDGSLYIVVAEVFGRGVAAAMTAAILQGIIHAQMLAGEPLEGIAANVNRFLWSHVIGKFARMALVKVGRDGKGEYLNCGRVPPLILRDGCVVRLGADNLAAGVMPGSEYSSQPVELRAGDRFLIFNDGVLTAENAAGEQFGDTNLDCLSTLRTVNGILEEVSRFVESEEQRDDWTVFQLQFSAL